MARTEREIAATKVMEAALTEFRDAYKEAHPEARTGMITDWIIIASEIVPHPEDPEQDDTLYAVMVSGGNLAWHRAAGLLKWGEAWLEQADVD